MCTKVCTQCSLVNMSVLTYVSNDHFGQCQTFRRHYMSQKVTAIYVLYTNYGYKTAHECFENTSGIHFVPTHSMKHTETAKNAAVNKKFNLLLRHYTYVLYSDIDELFLARGYPTLLDYIRNNTHRAAVGGFSMELHTSVAIKPTQIDWSRPLTTQIELYYNNVCTLNKMVLSRIPIQFTFGQHHLKSKYFTYRACQKECLDDNLIILHTKCVTSLGWIENMSDSFRVSMGRTKNMTKYILNRCMPRTPLIPIPTWISA